MGTHVGVLLLNTSAYEEAVRGDEVCDDARRTPPPPTTPTLEADVCRRSNYNSSLSSVAEAQNANFAFMGYKELTLSIRVIF